MCYDLDLNCFRRQLCVDRMLISGLSLIGIFAVREGTFLIGGGGVGRGFGGEGHY